MPNYLSLFLICWISFYAHARETISFRTDITQASVEELIRKVDRALLREGRRTTGTPEVVVKLGSPGGDLRAALRFVDEIQSRLNGPVPIHTHVKESCESACTIMFTAGRERRADSDAKFGFHSPGIEGSVPRGYSRTNILANARADWLTAIARVDTELARWLDDHGYLVGEEMKYISPRRSSANGYVTRVFR